MNESLLHSAELVAERQAEFGNECVAMTRPEPAPVAETRYLSALAM